MSERPLSPHLQVYKPQLTSVLSIIHRITGATLAFGTVVVIYWLYGLAAGPEAFADANQLMGSLFGKLVLMALAFCLFFHFFNGIRHLIWDTGHALELESAYATGWAVLILSILATGLSWLVLWGVMS